MSGPEIVDDLLGGRRVDGKTVDQPSERARARRIEPKALGNLGAQARHRDRELVAPPGRLAEPERDAGRPAVPVLAAHPAPRDALDLAALLPALIDVLGEAAR